MKIIQAQGQTCNQFWIYSHYFSESLASGDKIIILAPNVAFKDYPNLTKQNFLKFPLFNKFCIPLFSYNKYVLILNKVFANKFSIKFFISLFKIIPKVNFIEGKMGGFTDTNRSEYNIDLKTIFKPTEAVIENVNTFIKEKRLSYDVIVGIHIRRGDYLIWQNGKFFYSDDDYSSVMNQMKALFPEKRVGFLICSNEKIELENFKKHDTFVFDKSSASLDLYGLGVCDYILGPPSSYSTWASYYGNIPIYYMLDLKNKISLEQFYDEELLWPPLLF